MIILDPVSSLPPFEQIKTQVIRARATGAMPPGHRLPPVRHLAAELGLAPNTVARAYRELEADGIIETRGRQGSFVAGSSDQIDQGAEAARHYVRETRRLGISPEIALRLVRVELGT